jgi:uncharacterized SAM-binding protein YcdF (DUF218 family)
MTARSFVRSCIRAIKWGAAVLLAVTAIGALYTGYVYRQVRGVAERDDVENADVIVVMGAAQYNGNPSPVLKARLDHAMNLYGRGYAGTIITTGGYGPDPNVSEAHVGARYLVEHGVGESHILTQQGSGTTYDSVRAAAVVMHERMWRHAIVVSDGFHLLRVKTIFKDEGIAAFTSPAPASPIEISASGRLWYSLREVLLLTAYRLMPL